MGIRDSPKQQRSVNWSRELTRRGAPVRNYFARFAFFLLDFLPGQPCCISLYAFFDTVDFDLGRDLPARLRRLIFATSEFFCFDARLVLRAAFFVVAIFLPRLA